MNIRLFNVFLNIYYQTTGKAMKQIILLIFTLVLVSGCTSLKTPELNGAVVDAETGKPIEGARVYAKWQKTVSGPGGQTGGAIAKELRLQVRGDGRFAIPAYTLRNYVPYPFGQGGTFYMIVYAHGYKDEGFTFVETSNFEKPKYEAFRNRPNGEIRVILYEVKDDETYFHQIGKNLSATGEDYYLEDMQFFMNKFSSSKWCPTVQNYMAQYYEDKGDYSAAIKGYEELIRKYSKDILAVHARQAIERIRKSQKSGK